MFLLFKPSPNFFFFGLIFVLKNIEDIRFNSFTCVTFKMDKLDKIHVISSYHFDPKKIQVLSLSLSLIKALGQIECREILVKASMTFTKSNSSPKFPANGTLPMTNLRQ